MTTEELKRACVNLRGTGLDFALLSSHENIAYVSGFDEPVPIGAPRDFSGGFPLAMVILNAKEETGTLLVADTYGGLASEQSTLGTPVKYPIFDSFSPVDPVLSFVKAVKGILVGAGLPENARAKVGVELETLPAVLMRLFDDAFRSVTVADAGPSLEKSRRTKTPHEIQLLRRSAQVTDAGQRVFVEAAKNFTDATEFEVWAAVSAAVMEAAKKPFPVPLVGELVTGPRTNEVKYPGGPRQRRIAAGDTGILDISVRVDGYWSDCSNVVVFGREPTGDQKRHFKASKDGFEAAVGALRPGARCCDIEAAVRGAFKENGFGVTHYSGHQIGATVNERPRIVPFDTTPVEPGMVFCFEPGVYAGPGGTTGARLERMVLVTDSGSEILNQFPWGME
jgi:Xaa-Pro aminopeptidase